MQTKKPARTSHVQSSQTANPYARYLQADPRRPAVLLGVLCILLPPVGVALVWRSRRMTILLRAALSAVGFIAMTLIFVLLMRPQTLTDDIRPTPVVPSQAGYGTSATAEPTPEPTPEPTQVPAQEIPAVIMDPALTATETPAPLTDDSIVYAVTNNASSYHLEPICDMQENNRALTLRDALNEGLEPCAKCVSAAG